MKVMGASMAILLGAGVSILAVIAYVVLVVPTGELGEKRGWAVLQGVEVRYRSDPGIGSPVVLYNPMGSRYVVLGIPTHDNRFPMVWFIINEMTPTSSVYVLPQDQKYYVSCSYILELSSKIEMVPQVLEQLKANCTP